MTRARRIEMRFRVYPVDGAGEPWEVTAQTRDIYVWEKTTKGASMAQLSGDGVSMQAWYRLAHLAAVREQLTTQSLGDFVDTHDITLVDDQPDEDDEDESELDPT